MLTDFLTNNSFYMVSLLLNIFFVVLLVWQAKFLAGKLKSAQKHESANHEKLKREIKAISRGTYGVGQRVIEIEKSIRQSLETLNQGAVKNQNRALNSDPLVNLDEAEALFRKGYDTDSVAKRCGLSRSEASLMSLIRGLSTGEEAI